MRFPRIHRAISGRRRSRTFRTVLFLLLTLALFLVLAEAVLRVVGWFYYRPIDADLRRLASAPGEGFRILCLGDSHTYGLDASREQSYPRQLARLLNNASAGTNYVVVNGGVPGSNSSQALTLLNKVLAEPSGRPDLVVVCVGKNNNHNFRQARFWRDESMKTRSTKEQVEYLLANSKAYRLGLITVVYARLLLSLGINLEFSNVIWNHDFLVSWLVRDLEEMVDRVRGAGGEIAFLSYSLPAPSVDESMKIVARRKDVPVINVFWFGLPLGPVGMAGLTGPTGHPNAKGYAAVARSVHEALLKNALIPDAPGYREARAARSGAAAAGGTPR